MRFCACLHHFRSGKVTDIPAAHKSLKSPTNRNVGIAFGVVFAVILIAVFVIVLYKPSRRQVFTKFIIIHCNS